MKKNLLILPCIFLVCFCNSSSAQILKKPLFQNSYYGFATGFYPNGNSPSEVKAGDLDNDGDSDLVVAQQGMSNGFVVLINKGKGIYAEPIKYKSPKASQGIVIADFNNDQKNDVALANTGQYGDGNSVSVFINKGKGSFKAAVNYVVGDGPVGIIAGDFDNDGDNDLAVCNSTSASGTVSILTNKGDGNFNAAVNFSSGDKPLRIAAAKINKDNLIDLIIANNTQNVTILFNGGNNSFTSKLTLNVAGPTPAEDANATAKVADFDNDGDNDIIFSSYRTSNSNNGQIALFTNKGNGTFNAPLFIDLVPFTVGASDIDIADFDNDGKTDIIAANFSARTDDGYEILLNLGNNNFSSPVIKPAGQSTSWLTVADVDNDNKVDVITSDFYSLQVTIHKNAGNGNFPIPPLYSTNNSSAGSLDAADIDGDGDLDLVASASSVGAVGSTVTVLKNNGNANFSPGVAYSIRDGGVQAKFRDLNGDNKPDLIFATAISTPPYDFHTAINNGNGTFGARQTWSMDACGWSDIEAIDVDGDGDNDAVLTEWLGCRNVPNSARRLFISKNNGHGNFSAPIIKLINPTPSCIATGDFNKDGKVDIATGQFLSIDVHLNNSKSSIFNEPVTYATDQSPYDIIVTDLNGDGNLDLAACTEYVHEGMSVLLGNGDGTFQPAQNYNGAYSPDLRNESGITSGDIDGDGDIDILVGNYASNDVSLYVNNGNGTFSFNSRTGIYYGVESPLYADFSGDGKKDIVAIVSNPPTGITNSVAFLKGNILNTAFTANKPVDEQQQAIHTNSLNKISVINNPFTNHIDIKFAERPIGKVKFILSDVTGVEIAAKTEYNLNQNTYRLNIENKSVKSGLYFLLAEINNQKYMITVMHQ